MKPNMDEWTDTQRFNHNPQAFLEDAEIKLEYDFQPISDIHTGEVYGFEALLRNTKALGFQTPNDIFDFATSIGCLPEFELSLREKSIEKYSRIKNCKNKILFFNVYGKILEEDGFLINETKEILEKYDLNPENLCMEVPETYEITSLEIIEQFVSMSRNMGFPFAIDDFGRGYSQLKLLYEYEPDILKIDRFFISSIQEDARKRLFVSSVVDLAHTLGIRIIAEGVETAGELNVCRAIGCELVQGYFVARPIRDLTQILEYYPLVAQLKEDQKDENISEHNILDAEIEKLPTLHENDPIFNAIDIFKRFPEQTILPIVNLNGKPKGIIKEVDLKPYLYTTFDHDLLNNSKTDNSLRRFICRCPIADIQTRLEHLVETTTGMHSSGLIITKNGRYYGFLSNLSLLKIANQIRLQNAEDHNLLTKLPGNTLVSDYTSREAQQSGTERFFCFIDFNYFKPFNETYGFSTGDRAIILFSELMRRGFITANAMLGHISGDDFFIGLKEEAIDDVATALQILRTQFSWQAESLYKSDHLKQGFITIQDQHGITKRISLLTFSIAILHLPKSLVINDKDLLERYIAKLKRGAKTSPNGILIGAFNDNNEMIEYPATLINDRKKRIYA